MAGGSPPAEAVVRIVVCGAGTAGCVAAARLSQEPCHEVVLLEVGPHYRAG